MEEEIIKNLICTLKGIEVMAENDLKISIVPCEYIEKNKGTLLVSPEVYKAIVAKYKKG